MKKLLFLLAAVSAVAIGAMLGTSDVKAQCNGVFPANTFCGNNSLIPAPPAAVPATAITAGGTVQWNNVKSSCGAKGDGTTDDTAAINTCIATFNTAGGGVLYFPTGKYKTTTGLTAVTANGIITGDGQSGLRAPADPAASVIQSATTSIALFTVNSSALTFKDLSIQNIAGTTPITGSAGILVTSGDINQKVDYIGVQVANFFIDIDVKVGTLWSMINTTLWNPVQYTVRINNTINSDSGDWAIANSFFYAGSFTNASSTAIRIEGSGGGKIVNAKINCGNVCAGGNGQFNNGIDVIANNTVDLQIAASSIEGFTGTGININGNWPGITITGIEIGPFIPTPVHAISAVNTNDLVIIGVTGSSAGNYSGTPINLSNCTNCYVSGLNGPSLANPFAGGSKPDRDGTGGIGTYYFTDNTAGSNAFLNWTGPSGDDMKLQLQLGGTPSTHVAALQAINDIGNYAQVAVVGSTNATFPNAGIITAQGQLALISNDTGVSGGTSDITIRPGGFNQVAMTASHNGAHVSFPGTAMPAPTIAGGCGGTSSIVSGSDTAANVTGQNSNVTSCILQFGTAFTSTPICTATGGSSPLTGTVTYSTTSLTVHFAGTTSYQWSYTCLGT